LVILVFGLPVLVVLFAVLMGGAAVADLFQDPVGAKALRWIAVASLMLLLVDAIFLVGLLGFDAIRRREDSEQE